MEIQENNEVIDFNVYALLNALNYAVEAQLTSAKVQMSFDFGPELELQLRGNCQRLGETLANLVRSAVKHPGYGDILMTIRCESLTGDRVLLQFEISSQQHQGPTFRYFAGLPLGKGTKVFPRLEVRT